MSTERTFDIVIIGAGPAGLSAAAEVAKAGLSCVVVDRMGPGGQLMNLGALIGVDGLDGDATGPDLVAKLTEAAMDAGAELAIDDVSRVTVGAGGGPWRVEGLDATYVAPAVIVASGLTPGTTGLAEESRYEGQGLSHCAHCDAPLYAGKPVAVAGSDAWAVEEAIELAHHAGRVTLIAEQPPVASSDRLAILEGLANVEVRIGRIAQLAGDGALSGVTVEGAAGEAQIPAQGLFLYTRRAPALGFLDRGAPDEAGVIFAGDARQGSVPTITEAIADGARAGQNAVALLRGPTAS
jgi:thioredoxin reductase (NADPH)